MAETFVVPPKAGSRGSLVRHPFRPAVLFLLLLLGLRLGVRITLLARHGASATRDQPIAAQVRTPLRLCRRE